MPSFSLTPLTDVPPPAQDDFPNFIQFQNAGTDLGTPDADTLNFSTGLTATRGVGENANVVTVVASGGAAASYGVINLSATVGPGLFDSTPFPTSWNDTVVVANDSWSFDGATATLTFSATGTYRVIATCAMTGQGIEGAEWPAGETSYGSWIGSIQSTQFRQNFAVLTATATWTDQAVIQVTDSPTDVVVQLYAIAISDGGAVVADCTMSLVIERLGD